MSGNEERGLFFFADVFAEPRISVGRQSGLATTSMPIPMSRLRTETGELWRVVPYRTSVRLGYDLPAQPTLAQHRSARHSLTS